MALHLVCSFFLKADFFGVIVLFFALHSIFSCMYVKNMRKWVINNVSEYARVMHALSLMSCSRCLPAGFFKVSRDYSKYNATVIRSR